jgi:hypothetical protein
MGGTGSRPQRHWHRQALGRVRRLAHIDQLPNVSCAHRQPLAHLVTLAR